MNDADLFRRIIGHFDQHGVAFMLVGSFASTFYGATRTTLDADFVIDATAPQLRRLVADLEADDYYAEVDAAMDALRHESLFNIIDNKTGWKIDLIVLKSRPFDREEFRRRKPAQLFDVHMRVATAEDVIVSKLEWAKLGGSQRQIEDVARLLASLWKTLDHAYLAKWISALQLEQQWSAARQFAEGSD
jgi:hypothetical protein